MEISCCVNFHSSNGNILLHKHFQYMYYMLQILNSSVFFKKNKKVGGLHINISAVCSHHQQNNVCPSKLNPIDRFILSSSQKEKERKGLTCTRLVVLYHFFAGSQGAILN